MKNITEIDRAFFAQIREFESKSREEIQEYILEGHRSALPVNREIMEQYFDRFPFWGSLHDAEGDHTAIELRARNLHENRAELAWLYGRLEDYRSRAVLHAILQNLYRLDYDLLGRVKEQVYEPYFDLDVMSCDAGEVLLDLGAFTGDTVLSYLRCYGARQYRRIYCYEITPESFVSLRRNVGYLPDVVIRPVGVGVQNGIMCIEERPDQDSNSLSVQEGREVEVVSIDEDIAEPVTFIKMDIEGAEQQALRGCARHIRAERPKLAISVYHNNEDIWQVPRLIDEICPGYRFYLRYYGATETTLLAVHEEQIE